ncbi:MAG TPA: hypothetical protein VHT75_05555 [Acidimicrobiales bacterium]|nr:hypothetical protein [Acidimicrobiales bacterium]
MTPVLAVTQTNYHYWTIAIVGGIIIIVAAATLLSLLIWAITIIDKRVVAINRTLRAAEANVSNTRLIPATADRVEAVLNEGLEHHLFLGRVLGKVRM